jgi:hypothetical protein
MAGFTPTRSVALAASPIKGEGREGVVPQQLQDRR